MTVTLILGQCLSVAGNGSRIPIFTVILEPIRGNSICHHARSLNGSLNHHHPQKINIIHFALTTFLVGHFLGTGLVVLGKFLNFHLFTIFYLPLSASCAVVEAVLENAIADRRNCSISGSTFCRDLHSMCAQYSNNNTLVIFAAISSSSLPLLPDALQFRQSK